MCNGSVVAHTEVLSKGGFIWTQAERRHCGHEDTSSPQFLVLNNG